jgi:2-amino-4-hydroxy-6-hydroxymethyldihydropteridine diphosphokinase
MAEALIGLGGNLGDVRQSLECAVGLLCADTSVRLVAQSSDYRTPPWGPIEQPPFINRCIVVETLLSPHDLLERALGVERRLGRDRTKERRWGPRPIDIDLLSYGDVVLDDPGLKLPHPELFRRAFVLVPLAEIAADRIVAGTRVADALAPLDTSGIERLTPD